MGRNFWQREKLSRNGALVIFFNSSKRFFKIRSTQILSKHEDSWQKLVARRRSIILLRRACEAKFETAWSGSPY